MVNVYRDPAQTFHASISGGRFLSLGNGRQVEFLYLELDEWPTKKKDTWYQLYDILD